MIISKTKKPRTSDYNKFLAERLREPELAAGYLTACMEEGEEAFLLGLKDVAEAREGMGSLAKAASLNREGLYKMLSENGNPRLSSLAAILDALGLKLQFSPKHAA